MSSITSRARAACPTPGTTTASGTPTAIPPARLPADPTTSSSTSPARGAVCAHDEYTLSARYTCKTDGTPDLCHAAQTGDIDLFHGVDRSRVNGSPVPSTTSLRDHLPPQHLRADRPLRRARALHVAGQRLRLRDLNVNGATRRPFPRKGPTPSCGLLARNQLTPTAESDDFQHFEGVVARAVRRLTGIADGDPIGPPSFSIDLRRSTDDYRWWQREARAPGPAARWPGRVGPAPACASAGRKASLNLCSGRVSLVPSFAGCHPLVGQRNSPDVGTGTRVAVVQSRHRGVASETAPSRPRLNRRGSAVSVETRASGSTRAPRAEAQAARAVEPAHRRRGSANDHEVGRALAGAVACCVGRGQVRAVGAGLQGAAPDPPREARAVGAGGQATGKRGAGAEGPGAAPAARRTPTCPSARRQPGTRPAVLRSIAITTAAFSLKENPKLVPLPARDRRLADTAVSHAGHAEPLAAHAHGTERGCLGVGEHQVLASAGPQAAGTGDGAGAGGSGRAGVADDDLPRPGPPDPAPSVAVNCTLEGAGLLEGVLHRSALGRAAIAEAPSDRRPPHVEHRGRGREHRPAVDGGGEGRSSGGPAASSKPAASLPALGPRGNAVAGTASRPRAV